MSDGQKQLVSTIEVTERAAWQRPDVKRLAVADAEQGSGSGGDGLSQVQS